MGKPVGGLDRRMAISRKGWRPIVVDERELFWKASMDDEGFAVRVVVLSTQAFIRGQTAQQLCCRLPYGGLVTPLLVRRLIEGSRAFTGEPGMPDVSAAKDLQAELSRMSLESH